MHNLAQALSDGVAMRCSLELDGNNLLEVVWLAMLVVGSVLTIWFFWSREPKFGSLFALYVVILVLARLFNPTDQCGHGGLFTNRQSEDFMLELIVFSFVFISTAIFAGLSQRRTKHRLKGK